MLIAEAAWNAQVLYEKMEIDSEKVNVLYQVASAFAEAQQMIYSPDGYRKYTHCSVCWPFHVDLESYRVFFKPWLNSIPDYWDKITGSHRDFYNVKASFQCPYCKAKLLTLDYFGKPSESISHFQKEYKKTEIVCRKDKLSDHFIIEPNPHLVTYGFHCPKCEKPIILKQYETEGEKEEDRVAEAEEKWKGTKHIVIETNSTLHDSELASCLKVITKWLTVPGFYSFKNQFLAWANVEVAKLEMKISQNINQAIWNEFFKAQRENEEESSSHEPS